MEVNRFLCFKKKKKRFLKLKPCLLGDRGMPGSGVCVRRGGRCRDWYLTPPWGLIAGCRGCWGQWDHLLGVFLHHRPGGAKQTEGEGGVSEFLQQLV